MLSELGASRAALEAEQRDALAARVEGESIRTRLARYSARRGGPPNVPSGGIFRILLERRPSFGDTVLYAVPIINEGMLTCV